MEKKNIVIILIILLVVGLLIFLISKQKVEYYKHVELSNNNIITNKTSKSYLDTLVSKGLDVLDLKGKYVIIKNLDPSLKEALGTDTELRAAIIGERDQYVIYIDDLGRHESLTILSHELIHLEQYSSGRLKKINNRIISFNNEIYDISVIQYRDRPWEIEAFSREKDLKNTLENSLF